MNDPLVCLVAALGVTAIILGSWWSVTRGRPRRPFGKKDPQDPV